MSLRKPVIVSGIELPRRRFTGWALVYFLVFICLPVLGIGAILDATLYVLFAEAFDSCYAVFCLFEQADNGS